MVEFIRWLVHELLLIRNTLCIGFQDAASGQIVPLVDRAAFVAVQVVSVACKSDQVRHSG